MSNYIWTDKQIHAAIERGKKRSQEVWLGVAVFKIGKTRDINNKIAQSRDYRQLMEILVERKSAFDNKKDCEDPNFKICFNWKEKNRILESIKPDRSYFSPGLLSHPDMINLPLKEVLDFPSTAQDLGRTPTDEDKMTFYKQRFRWTVIRDSLSIFQDTGKLGLRPFYESYVDKESRRILVGIVLEIACMYKAFELGWPEIKDSFPRYPSHDHLFIMMLRVRSHADFIDECCLPGTALKLYGDIKRMQSMHSVTDSIYDCLEQSPELLYQNPHEALSFFGFDSKQLNNILKAAQSMADRSPAQNEWVQVATKIKTHLLQNFNPVVKNAAMEWERASHACLENAMRYFRKAIRDKTKSSK
jgi:hypothetical protein